MMNQAYIIPNYIVIACLMQLHAQIHIIKSYCKRLIKAPDLTEFCSLYHQARRRHRQTVIVQTISSIIIHLRIILAQQCMGWAHADIDDARVLDDPASRIIQLRPDGSCMRQCRLSCHTPEPVRLDHFYIIIQKKQKFSLCMLRAQIAHPCKVKRHRFKHILDGMYPTISIDPLPVLRAASIVNKHNLPVGIGRIFLQRIHAGCKKSDIVFGRNDNTDLRRPPLLIDNSAQRHIRNRLYMSSDSPPPECLLLDPVDRALLVRCNLLSMLRDPVI